MNDDNNLDLRGSIRNLKIIAKTLDAASFNFNLDAVKNFADKLDDKAIEPRPPIDLEQLLEKFLRGDKDFSRQDLKNLPHIIYHPKLTLNHAQEIWNTLDIDNKRQLSGVIYVYLRNHDDSPKTDFLRQKLNAIRYDGFSQALKKIFAARENLFGDNRFANMTKLFAQNLSVNDSLATIGLSDFYKTSNFIQAALKNFFRSDASTLAGQMKLLTELDAEFDAYKNIFPAIADALIQTVYHSGQFKKQCITIFYRRLGDPRFGNGRFNWQTVSPKSRDIFSHWLSEEDLETFFRIVAETTNDEQWGYREKFWRKYLPYITNTWIFLARDARRYAVQSNLNHGTLKNGYGNQAVFVFQIRKYIFSEWSNVGKVRAHDLSHSEKFFGSDDLNGEFIRKNFVDGWIHFPHGGANCWQDKVRTWIRANC